MNPVDPLAQLRDIHLPSEVSAWPPGPGWWALAVLLVLALAAGAWWAIRRYRSGAWRRQALKELSAAHRAWQGDADTATFLQSLSAVLKRAALGLAPDAGAARLSGKAWCEFLDSRWQRPPDRGFSALGFAELVYAPAPKGEDVDELLALGQRWLRQQRGQP